MVVHIAAAAAELGHTSSAAIDGFGAGPVDSDVEHAVLAAGTLVAPDPVVDGYLGSNHG